MNCKRITILTGYDYSESLRGIDEFINQVIIPKNEPMLSSEARKNLQDRVGNKLVTLDYSDVQKYLECSKPQILITLGWRRIISNGTINLAGLAVNIHPALLPEYKGYHPVPYVLRNREKHHGITAHLITDEMDGGDIVYQEKFEITRYSTLSEIQETVNVSMPSFLKKLCEKLLSNNYELSINDPLKTKVVAEKRTPEDSEIPLDMTIDKAYDYIRACDQDRFPAYIKIDGRKIYIKIAFDN